MVMADGGNFIPTGHFLSPALVAVPTVKATLSSRKAEKNREEKIYSKTIRQPNPSVPGSVCVWVSDGVGRRPPFAANPARESVENLLKPIDLRSGAQKKAESVPIIALLKASYKRRVFLYL